MFLYLNLEEVLIFHYLKIFVLQHYFSILNKIDKGDGSAAKIINNDDLVKEMEETLISIKSLVDDFEKNPEKYLKEIKLLRK